MPEPTPERLAADEQLWELAALIESGDPAYANEAYRTGKLTFDRSEPQTA